MILDNIFTNVLDYISTNDLASYLRVQGEVASSRVEETDLDADPLSLPPFRENVASSLNSKLYNHTVGFLQTRLEALEAQEEVLKGISTSMEMLQKEGLPNDLKEEYADSIRESIKRYQKNYDSYEYQGVSVLSNETRQMSFMVNAEGRRENYTLEPLESGSYGTPVTLSLDFGYFFSSSSDEDKHVGVNLSNGNKEVLLNGNENEGLAGIVQAIQEDGDGKVSASSDVMYYPFENNPKAVKAGTTPEDFSINGQVIAVTTVQDEDADGALQESINQHQEETGVTINVNGAGVISFHSESGRAIEIQGDLWGLSELNILNKETFPEVDIDAQALFLKGATLSEYEYSFGRTATINTIDVKEYDGDNGYYNVYIVQNGETALQGERVQASGDSESKNSRINFETLQAEGLVVRPLNSKGQEGKEKGLGGWWELQDVQVRWLPDQFIYVGVLELDKPSDRRVLDLDEGLGVSEKVEQYQLDDLIYLDLEDEEVLSVAGGFLDEVQEGVKREVNVAYEELVNLYNDRENLFNENVWSGISSDKKSFEMVKVDLLIEFGREFTLAHQEVDSERVKALLGY